MARKLIAGAAGRGQGAEAGTGLAPAAARTEGRLAPAGGFLFLFFFNLQVLGQAHGLFWTFWGLRHILAVGEKFSFFFFFFLADPLRK